MSSLHAVAEARNRAVRDVVLAVDSDDALSIRAAAEHLATCQHAFDALLAELDALARADAACSNPGVLVLPSRPTTTAGAPA